MTPDEQTTKLLNIFLPYAAGCRERMVRENARFVHYTSAANALSIIKSRRIWMRNTKCMSDYREVQHGFDALNRYFSNESHRQAFASALNDCYQGAADEIVTLFNQWWHTTQLQTYVTSISEQLVYGQCRIEASRVSAAEPPAEITRECQLRVVTLGHAPMSAQCPVWIAFRTQVGHSRGRRSAQQRTHAPAVAAQRQREKPASYTGCAPKTRGASNIAPKPGGAPRTAGQRPAA
jgi:hypothetical protein